MTDCVEIAITSDSSEQLWSCCVWDVRTGTHLMSYKGGGAVGPHTLSIIKNQFIASGNLVKPMIHIWPINSHEPVNTRFILPGRPTSMAISPDGNYSVIGIQETVYIFQLATGLMLASLARHYQAVNTIKFMDDGMHFITAGQDGMVLIWSLPQVIRMYQKKPASPVYSFSDHALPVTDVYVGKGGMKATMCTVSIDRACKVYDLRSGELLLNLVFQEPLSSVTMDHLESNIFVGTNEGSIYTFSLLSPPRMKEFHVGKKEMVKNVFSGHKKMVTCLSVSIDGDTLMSGSADESVIIWNIKSRQQLRTIGHKGTVTNAFFMLTPKVMFNQGVKLTPIFSQFQRMVYNNDKAEEQTIEVLVKERPFVRKTKFIERATAGSSVGQDELDNLRKEVERLKKVNKEIYEFTVQKIAEK